jgi:hypothetical protein
MGYQRGEFVRIIADRTEKGIITQAHVTQMPSPANALLLSVWALIHVILSAAFCRSTVRRRLKSLSANRAV